MNDDGVALDPWRGVYRALRAAIISGEYPPGTRLIEQRLADRYRTSRGPIRTALQELERAGLVLTIARRGSFVLEISAQDIEEIVSLWKLVFEFAVRRAVVQMGPDERSWFESFKEREIVTTDPDLYVESGIELTRQVVIFANHRRILNIYDSLLVQSQGRSIFFTATEGTAELDWRRVSHYNDELCDAMVRGDAEGAIALSDAFLNELGVWRQQRTNP